MGENGSCKQESKGIIGINMKDHNKTLYKIKDVEEGMKRCNQKEKFKDSTKAILGFFNLVNDMEFQTYMLIKHSLWINVCMFAEDEPHIPVMGEEIKFTPKEIRSQIMETWGKIIYYAMVKGNTDIHVEPVKEHFDVCFDYIEEIMNVGKDGD